MARCRTKLPNILPCQNPFRVQNTINFRWFSSLSYLSKFDFNSKAKDANAFGKGFDNQTGQELNITEEEYDEKMKQEASIYLHSIENLKHLNPEIISSPTGLQENLITFEQSLFYTPERLYKLLLNCTLVSFR